MYCALPSGARNSPGADCPRSDAWTWVLRAHAVHAYGYLDDDTLLQVGTEDPALEVRSLTWLMTG